MDLTRGEEGSSRLVVDLAGGEEGWPHPIVDPAACGQQLVATGPPSQDGVHGDERSRHGKVRG